MSSPCIRTCVRTYGRDLDTKAVIVITGCALGALFLGDFTGQSFMLCLAAGGIADVTVGLSACILKCLRRRGLDDGV